MAAINKLRLSRIIERACFFTRTAIERRITLTNGVAAQINKLSNPLAIKSLLAGSLMTVDLRDISLQELLHSAKFGVDSIELVEWSDTVTKDTKTSDQGATSHLLADIRFQKIKSATVTITAGHKRVKVTVPLNIQRETVSREWWE
jgi:hypothetical protein